MDNRSTGTGVNRPGKAKPFEKLFAFARTGANAPGTTFPREGDRASENGERVLNLGRTSKFRSESRSRIGRVQPVHKYRYRQQLGSLRTTEFHFLHSSSERLWFPAEDRRRAVGAVDLALGLLNSSQDVFPLVTFELFFGGSAFPACPLDTDPILP
jgi:hypothetical protein